MSTYRTDERGVLNNFPNEVQDEVVEPPSQKQMVQYALGGVVAVLFLGSILWVAFAVSA